ncbi:MAG: EscU/YscU/HrcU family type III secretion system export apparatus switch protein [Candidatus Eremiobacteraeota bacterium]|nr:EscU/YscU/HrcU family type III secretion system export apparatus switch protein [Candidatus Eremiobacteraeota bacterium]
MARARREGDVARAGDATSLAAFASALLGVAVAAPGVAHHFAASLSEAAHGRVTSAALAHGILMPALFPAAFATIGASALATLVAGGLAVRAPRCDWSRCAPWKGVQRIFSRDTVFALLKTLLGSAVVALALGIALARTAQWQPREAFALAFHMRNAAALTCGLAVGFGCVLAAADAASARSSRLRRLRMSAEEVRRDQKESDGDPLVRGRRRRAHDALARSSLARMREAAFVVTNPTHVAIALAYRPPEIAVPRVVVRAQDEAALAARARARELGIPIVEDIALARGLFAAVAVDGYIPRDRYDDVARVVAGLTRAGLLEA